MSDVARRARQSTLVALGGALLLAACVALTFRTGSTGGPATHDPTTKPVTLDQASLPQAARPLPTTPPRPAAVVSPDGRQGIDPADLDRLPRDPLTPPEIFVEAEVSPRGAMTAEPLVPPVIRVDVEVSPRGAMTAEPLVPPVVENPAEPARR